MRGPRLLSPCSLAALKQLQSLPVSGWQGIMTALLNVIMTLASGSPHCALSSRQAVVFPTVNIQNGSKGVTGTFLQIVIVGILSVYIITHLSFGFGVKPVSLLE